MPASFVYLTGERNHLCEAFFGIEYGNVRGATYDIRYVSRPSGAVDDDTGVVPQAVQDADLGVLKPPAPKGTHFKPLAGGGGTPYATVPHCLFAANSYAAQYAKLTVYAVLP